MRINLNKLEMYIKCVHKPSLVVAAYE